MQLTDEDLLKMARARVGFKMHAAAYVVVNLFFVGIWFLTAERSTATFTMGDMTVSGSESDHFWPIWPLLGWGVGLAMHGYGVYGAGKNWEARELEKLRAKYGKP